MINRSHLRWFTALLIILAVAFVLITPQIDMPDAVVSSYKVVGSSLTHLSTVSFSAIKIGANLLRPRPFTCQTALFHRFSAALYADSHVLRAQICILRF